MTLLGRTRRWVRDPSRPRGLMVFHACVRSARVGVRGVLGRRAVLTLGVIVPVVLAGCAGGGSTVVGTGATVAGRTAPSPVGFPAREFRMAAPGFVVVGGAAQPTPTCTPGQITASAATRNSVDGVLGVVHLAGGVVAHRRGLALRCRLPIRRGPSALLAADDHTLDVHLAPGDRTTPPSNPRPDLALDSGKAIWGFAWLGSYCGAHAAAIQIPLHRPGTHSLQIPLRGPQPRCNPSANPSVLIDGVPGWPGQPVQPARPEYSQLRLNGHIQAGTTSSRLAPIDLALRTLGTAPITLDPCPGYAGRDFAHAHSGGFGSPISSGSLPCTNHQLVIKPGEVLRYTIPATSLVPTPGTGAIPGSTVHVGSIRSTV